MQLQGYELYQPLLESWARAGRQLVQEADAALSALCSRETDDALTSRWPTIRTPRVTGLVRLGFVMAVFPEKLLQVQRNLPPPKAAAIPKEPFNVAQHAVSCAGPLKRGSEMASSLALELASVFGILVRQDQQVRAQRR